MNGKLRERASGRAVGARRGQWPRAVLPLILLSLALVVSAVPALNVAIPDLASDTGATMSQLQWIVDAYALVFAALLLPAGAVGDRYGRQPVLVWGLAIFALGSAGAAHDHHTECADRFPGCDGYRRGACDAFDPVDHHDVVASRSPQQSCGRVGRCRRGWRHRWPACRWCASGAVGMGFGVLVVRGAALAIGIAAFRLIPNSLVSDPPRVDYIGGLLSVVTLTGLVYGAIEGPERGWGDVATLGRLPWVARRSSRGSSGASGSRNRCWIRGCSPCAGSAPVWCRSRFSSSSSSVSSSSSSSTCSWSWTTHRCKAGLALLPMGMAIGAVSRRVPHLTAKAGRRPLALAGLVLIAIGMLVLSTLDPSSTYWLVLGGILPVGVGMALAMAPATTDIVAALPAHKQGVASATNDAAREVGGTLGIAVLGSILNDQYRSGVAEAAPSSAPAELVDTAQQSLGLRAGHRVHARRARHRPGLRCTHLVRGWPVQRLRCLRRRARPVCDRVRVRDSRSSEDGQPT